MAFNGFINRCFAPRVEIPLDVTLCFPLVIATWECRGHLGIIRGVIKP